jgi:hypothetical protein
MELVVTVAWYNCVFRILLPLRIEKRGVVYTDVLVVGRPDRFGLITKGS